jgi:hypothetical protein
MVDAALIEHWPLFALGLVGFISMLMIFRALTVSSELPTIGDEDVWRAEMAQAAKAASRIVRHTTEQEVKIGGYTVTTGTTTRSTASGQPDSSWPFVAVINPPDAPPFELAAPPHH